VARKECSECIREGEAGTTTMEVLCLQVCNVWEGPQRKLGGQGVGEAEAAHGHRPYYVVMEGLGEGCLGGGDNALCPTSLLSPTHRLFLSLKLCVACIAC